MNIRIDDLTRPEVHALLNEHLAHMHSITPAESVHALPIDELRKPDITFWCAWDEAELLGCGALKELTPRHGEVKSMRTVRAHLRKGVARAILVHIIAEARRRAYERLSLETGSMAEFQPAVRLYASFGFTSCAPFGDYIEDPNSLFMTKKLS
jgi:putative acetyltransferase